FVMLFVFFFFFSSRRRHTRSKRDWSSDVCSSDLGRTVGHPGGGREDLLDDRTGRGCQQDVRPGDSQQCPEPVPLHDRGKAVCPRSEERRVGKECRRAWARRTTRKEKQ